MEVNNWPPLRWNFFEHNPMNFSSYPVDVSANVRAALDVLDYLRDGRLSKEQARTILKAQLGYTDEHLKALVP